VSKHDDLPLKGFVDKSAGYMLPSAVVKRGHRVVKHGSALMAGHPKLGKEGSNGKDALFAFAQDLLGLLETRKVKDELHLCLALVVPSLQSGVQVGDAQALELLVQGLCKLVCHCTAGQRPGLVRDRLSSHLLQAIIEPFGPPLGSYQFEQGIFALEELLPCVQFGVLCLQLRSCLGVLRLI
jgi:hypothetical protein